MSYSNLKNNYEKIIKPVQYDIELLDKSVENHFSANTDNNNSIQPIIKEFLAVKGKRLRPAMMFLLASALNKKNDDFICKLALSNEILHNATLIHDDIIDCAILRREHKTLNFNYDSKLAVLAGDYLFSEVLNILSSIENKEIRNLYGTAISNLINGELFQYFNRFKIFSIEQYIQKSMDKTARLFEAGLVSVYIYCSDNHIYLNNIRDFAINFGIGFQIKNDLENINNEQKTSEDLNNGDYNAPVIYFAQEKYNNKEFNIKNVNQFLKQLKQSSAIEKTKNLSISYFNKAIENISFLEDNLYKQALIDLCKLLIEN